MAKEKMNHRRKAKQDRVYEELDISKFNDILKKPDKKKPYKGKKKYPPKGDSGNKPTNKEQQIKKPGDKKPNNKPNKPNNKPKPQQQQSKPNNKPKGKQ